MSEYIKISLKIIWLIVIGYWVFSSFKVKNVEKTSSFFKNFIFYWFPLIAAIFLLGPGDWFGDSWLREKFVDHTNTVGLIGLFLCIIGAVICCYSRYLLGKNWSLVVQQKENHELIKNGIYGIIRNPIYTGLLFLFAGNAIIVGDYRAIIAVLIILISFLFKIKKEEQLLSELFKNDYDEYRQKTKALIPYIY